MDKARRFTNFRDDKQVQNTSDAEEEVSVMLQRERERLIHERQDSVARVLDKHDDLVRELFHLERFVSLLSYSPQEAKKDVSPVFLTYKSAYDLVDHNATTGSSRTTRRAHTERLQSLQTNTSQPSVSVPPAARKTKASNRSGVDQDTIWTLLANAKGKGKAPADEASPSALATPRHRGRVKALESSSGGSNYQNNASDTHEQAASASSARRRRTTMGPPIDIPPTKKRKLDPRVIPSADIPDSPGLDSTADTYSSPFKGRLRRSVAGKSVDTTPTRVVSNGIAAVNGTQTPTTPIRRVTLIVRRPPPSFSSPRQKPPVPKFDSSLESCLRSYTTLDDEDLDFSTLEKMAKEDAVIWRQVDALRRRGRMLHRPPDTSSTVSSNSKSPERKPDIWDHVIDAVKAHANTHRPDGGYVAAQVASRVKTYWEAQTLRDDKARAQEEKRLRALAKATIRLVTTKWRDAVYHIRDQERKKREAEERRRGHEHLDAILDQSGQILEAQQVDLTRGDGVSRSRSTSLSATLRHRASVSPPPDESESDIDTDAGDESEDSEFGGGDGDGVQDATDSGQLLFDSHVLRMRSESNFDESETFDDPQTSSPPPIPDNDLQNDPHTKAPNDNDSTKPPILTNGKSNRYAPPPVFGHQHSSPCESPSEYGRDVKTGAEPSDTPTWREDVITDSPGQQKLRLRDASSSRSSVVPESGWDVHDVDPPTVTETEDAPPDSPTSLAVDAQSTASAQDADPAAPPSEAGIPFISDADDDHDGDQSRLLVESLLHAEDDSDAEEEVEEVQNSSIPLYLRPYAVTPVHWDSESKVKAPVLLRGTLRPYQQAGLEWLASLHMNNLNGILADEMGLGKTIQTISLLAHLACDRGIWGPHLIIVPTSVLLNWEMEFKKFLPGFKVLSYHGNTKRRKELRQGWNNKYHFNVCVTSYTLASRDAHVFKRKAWYYMILDEAHMIKNFKSQRWNILLMFRSFRRLLLTGTPLQNNLTELWALLQFLMSGTNFANLKEFGEWFSNPLEKAIEMGTALDDDNMQRVAKLHTVLRPYLLRRLKRDVEKELPSKYEHLVMCSLSKRQRFLYDEFMARAETRHDLQSGVYQKIANILMQLRKVVNHPDLFEVRPITTSFAMSRSAIADFEIKELLVRRELLQSCDEDELDLEFLGLKFVNRMNTSIVMAGETARLDGTARLPLIEELPETPPPKDTRTIEGYRRYRAYLQQAQTTARWKQIAYVNSHRCRYDPVLCSEVISMLRHFHTPLLPLSAVAKRFDYLDINDRLHSMIKSYAERAEEMSGELQRFAFATPAAVALDMPVIILAPHRDIVQQHAYDTTLDASVHPISVKLQIAFPDPSLLQFDCGKLQELARLLRERKMGGHRVLIFTQMTRVLDILEIFLNYHGYLYMRLDGATKIEDRQYITERFNTDARIFCFISSSRSGGVGINLTGADTVIFYDSDFNPQMDRQCEDRAHRIGQIRDVHIYRFISQHTVEEALLRKANQKRSLDDIVIQKGEFDWRTLFRDEGALTRALGEVEDTEDAHAAAVAAREAIDIEGADEADFAWEGNTSRVVTREEVNDAELKDAGDAEELRVDAQQEDAEPGDDDVEGGGEGDEDEEGGSVDDYMLSFVRFDLEFFREWRLPGFKE